MIIVFNSFSNQQIRSIVRGVPRNKTNEQFIFIRRLCYAKQDR